MGTLRGFPNPPATDSAGQSPAPSRRSAPRLYLITDRKATGGRPLVEVVAAALAGIAGSGLDPGDVAVQLREKDLDGRALTDLGRALRATTAAAGVRLFVNDRIDVALAVGADGVHLGGTSLVPAEARALAPALAIAVSTHGLADVRAAATTRRGRRSPSSAPSATRRRSAPTVRPSASTRWLRPRGSISRYWRWAVSTRATSRTSSPQVRTASPASVPSWPPPTRRPLSRALCQALCRGPRNIFCQAAVSDLTLFVTLVLSGPNFHGRAGERGTSQRS